MPLLRMQDTVQKKTAYSKGGFYGLTILVTNSKKMTREQKNFVMVLAELIKGKYYRRKRKNLLELIEKYKNTYKRICIAQKDSTYIKLVFADISTYPYRYLNPVIVIKDYKLFKDKSEIKKIVQLYDGRVIKSKSKKLNTVLEKLFVEEDLLGNNMVIKVNKNKMYIYADDLKLLEANVDYAKRKHFD
ncbi:MAG: hypothetical protein N3E37_03735 [Candidatus Micrarchaeota archaeon]|nr:hypothetical protein [Candidatus Micrarchaeota archaeon]